MAVSRLRTGGWLRNDRGMVVRGSWRLLLFQLVLVSVLLCNAAFTSGQGLVSTGGQPQTTGSTPQAIECVLTVREGGDWTDTGIALEPGNELHIEVANTASSAAVPRCKAATPGNPNSPRLRISSAPASALVAKLAANAQPFPVVENRNISITEPGHLFLAANDVDQCQATSVKVHVGPSTGTMVKNKLSNAAQIWLSGQFGTSSATSSTAVPANDNPAITNAGTAAKVAPAAKIPSEPLDSQLRADIDHSPRRVTDQFNHAGDMVKFVIIGSQQQLEKALADANWHIADTSNADAITKAIEMTRQNKDYVQMPMSVLYLFGRAQDFGYEQAEPYAVVASRHHFRIWKAPFTFKGEPVWLGAGTHDIGFEKDQRNGSVTHKIDPDVDLERQNIGDSLEKTGLVQALTEYLPPDPVQSAKNATGGGYHSDGRMLVITLK